MKCSYVCVSLLVLNCSICDFYLHQNWLFRILNSPPLDLFNVTFLFATLNTINLLKIENIIIINENAMLQSEEQIHCVSLTDIN
jgi:hypothetical protein